MNKIARKNDIGLNEKEDLLYTIMALSNFSSSGSVLLIVICMFFLGGSFFKEEILKDLIVSGITCAFSVAIWLYVSKKQFSFPYILCLKMALIKYKSIFHGIPIPNSLPQVWVLYTLR
jgi:hypothetical protein